MKFVIKAHDSKFIDVLEMDSLFEFEQVYQTLYLMIYQQFFGISGPSVVIPAKIGCCSFNQVFVTPFALRKSIKKLIFFNLSKDVVITVWIIRF